MLNKLPLIASAILIGLIGFQDTASAQRRTVRNRTPQNQEAGAPTRGAQRVDVDAIKEKYWARGDEAALGVVQNRLYSKANKFQLGTFGGITATDPFLSVKNAGISFGYNFSEYFALQALFMRSFSGFSSAHQALEKANGATDDDGITANTNLIKGYIGAEANGSLMYGKLSLLGKKIIYYDFHLIGGLGVTNTESGKYFTPSIGLGQQVYINKFMSLRVDYRMMLFKENIIEKEVETMLGEIRGQRTNYSHVFAVGVNFLLDFFGKR